MPIKKVRKLKTKFTSNSSDQKLRRKVSEIVKPNSIREKPSFLEINRRKNRVLSVVGWPSQIRMGFLNNLLDSNKDFQLTLHIEPVAKEAAISNLNRLLTKQKSDLDKTREEGKMNPALEQKISDTKKILDSVRTGEENIFWTSLNLNVQARDLENLDLMERKVKQDLDSLQLISKVPEYEMKKAYQTVMPFGNNHLDNKRRMPTSGLAEVFPFTSSSTEIEEKGIVFGFNNENPVIKDVFEKTNPNWLTVGTSGSGKSFAAKLMISRYAKQGVETFIIDPHGEYKGLVEQLGGRTIQLSQKADNMINPLDLMGYSYTEKILSLHELFDLMIGGNQGLTEPQKAELFKATRKTYKQKGIPENPDKENLEYPKLSNLVNNLKKKRNRVDDKVKKKTLNVLISRFDPYVNGVLSFFDTNTRLDQDVQVTCFDISELPSKAAPTAMYLILNYLSSNMQKSTEKRKMIVVDEAWQLLSGLHQDNEESFLYDTVKSSRKFNLSLGLIIQDIHDLVNSSAGKPVKSNTSTKMLMKQDESMIEGVKQFFNLNDNEASFLEKAGVGEALMLTDYEHIPIRFEASPKEKELFETEPGWKKQNNSENKPELKDTFKESFPEQKFDEVLFEEDLTDKQVEELKKRSDWGRTITSTFNTGRGKAAWVYCPGKLSPEHERMVKAIRNKAKEIKREKTSDETNIQISEKTGDQADLEIEFLDQEKTIGVEVETGSNLEAGDDRLEEKKAKNDAIYDEWFFVAMEYKKKDQYEHIHENTITRTQVPNKIEKLLT